MNNFLGENLKKLRKQKNVTMVELAQKSGHSQSYISQLERGLINPTVGALQKIASVLGVPTAFFFHDEEHMVGSNNQMTDPDEPRVKIVHPNKRKELVYPSSNIRYQLLSPDLKGPVEFMLITAPPKASTGDENFIHDGFEYGFILKGSMQVCINDSEVYLLKKGDSILFSSSTPHKWCNPSDTEELQAVWAVSPPSF